LALIQAPDRLRASYNQIEAPWKICCFGPIDMSRGSTRHLFLAACIAVLLGSACGRKHSSAAATRKTPARAGSARNSAPAKPGTTQTGLASWYGEPYHGRRAANGEIYDMNKLTAAHRTLPFDTIVNVLNLENKQQVQVRINDRGPFVDGRIIDLSRAAAQQISMLGPGTAKVRIEVMGKRAPETSIPASPVPASPPAAPPTLPQPQPDEPGTSAGYAVQIGAFSEAKAAEKLQRRMASRFGNAYIENVRSDKGILYRVRVGPKRTMKEAEQLAASLRLENFQSLVVRIDGPVKDC
jgi:rare lipoprotein A